MVTLNTFAQGLTLNGAKINISKGGTRLTIGGSVGNFTTENGATIENDGIITVPGNWTDNAGNGVFVNRNSIGAVVLKGTTVQSLSGSTNFENLTLNNASGASLSADQTVDNSLTLTSGVLSTGSHTLTSKSTVGSVISGHSNNSFISGNLRKHVGFSYALDFVTDISIPRAYYSPIEHPHSINFSHTTAFTVETWVKLYDGNNTVGTLIQRSAQYGWVLRYVYGTLQLELVGSGSIKLKNDTNVLNDNQWHHIAFTYDGSSDASGLIIYVDGFPLSTQVVSNDLSGGMNIEYALLKIGEITRCQMDETRIWKYARTQEEIQQTMNGLLTGTEPGLLVYYQYEDGPSSTSVTDISGHDYTGTFANNTWVSNTKHNTFNFPLGNGALSSNYHPISIEATSLDAGAFTYLDAKFDALATGGTLALSEEAATYVQIAPEGEWSLVADNPPTAINYNAKAYTTNISGLTDNQYTVLKRNDGSSNAADWSCAPCGFSVDPTPGINTDGGEGRMVADGYALRRGFSSFSKFGIGIASSALPIVLLDFKAKLVGDEVHLTWSTASEINNDYFTIEKTSDFNSFETVTEVSGKGNSLVTSHYSAIDKFPYLGFCYYRLKQTDFDGKFNYSNIVAVNYTQEINFAVFPNPVERGNIIYLRINEANGNGVFVSIDNLLGGNIYSMNLMPQGKSSIIPIVLNDKPSAGVYLVKISNGNGQYLNTKLIIK